MFIGGIYFEEESAGAGSGGGRKSPESQAAWDSARWTRIFKTRVSANGTDDAGRFAATKALLGYATVVGSPGTAGCYLSRVPPASYPAVKDAATNPSGAPYAWATSIPRIEPLGKVSAIDANASPTYDALRLTVEFNVTAWGAYDDPTAQTLCGNVPAGYSPATQTGVAHEGLILGYYGWAQSRNIARYIEPAPMALVLRQGLLQRNAVYSGINPASSPGAAPYLYTRQPSLNGSPMTIYREYVKYVWVGVPVTAVPRSYISQCSGHVNAQVFDGYPPGTLLLSSTKFAPRFSPLGYRTVDIAYTMIYKPCISNFWSSFPPPKYLTQEVEGIPVGWNSEPDAKPVVNADGSKTSKFYHWPISASGDPASFYADPFSNGQYVRTFNGTEPYPVIDFCPLFAPPQS